MSLLLPAIKSRQGAEIISTNHAGDGHSVSIDRSPQAGGKAYFPCSNDLLPCSRFGNSLFPHIGNLLTSFDGIGTIRAFQNRSQLSFESSLYFSLIPGKSTR